MVFHPQPLTWWTALGRVLRAFQLTARELAYVVDWWVWAGQVKAIQEQNRDEELQYMRDPFLPFQLIVQEPSHTGRLLLLAHMVEDPSPNL